MLDNKSEHNSNAADTLSKGPDSGSVQISQQNKVWDGFFKMWQFKLRHKLFEGGWTEEMNRELFHRGLASAAVLYDPVLDCVGLVEQFRIGAIDSALGPWTLEGVAGVVEGSETSEELIRRELVEEAGIEDCELISISQYYSSPGGCNEKIHLFCALCSLNGKAGHYGNKEEHEDIRFHVLPALSVFESMYDSRTNNAATLIGLQWLQQHRETLRRAVHNSPSAARRN